MPEPDTVFSLLSNERRRIVVQATAVADSQLGLGTLAERVAAREHDKPMRQITAKERKNVYIALYQQHLDKLDAAGVIQYDDRAKTVEATTLAVRLCQAIDDVHRQTHGDSRDTAGQPQGVAGRAD